MMDKTKIESIAKGKIERIANGIKAMGLGVMHFPSNGLLAAEVARRIKEQVSADEFEAAIKIVANEGH